MTEVSELHRARPLGWLAEKGKKNRRKKTDYATAELI
jgi:hypothetical protein